MGRFISGGGDTESGFTRAEVFTTPGTTTWSVPAGVSKAKVFVIGAGSNYRTTEFCFESSSCCSGVATPGSDYCLNFVGHLTGAGGGYAEKTLDGVAPGSSMTINVGSQGGLTASSISISGTTVTANNATETSVSWNCLSNASARDDSNDNRVSLGFDLPVCGYRNCINGYFNAGGTAVGGDVNRSGGDGSFVPYFRQDSTIDGTLCVPAASSGGGGFSAEGCTCTYDSRSGYDYSFGGRRYYCVCTIAYLKPSQSLNGGTCGCCFYWGGESNYPCLCLETYHTTFGGRCYYNMPWANCMCERLCNGAYLCVSSAAAASSGTTIAKSDGTSSNSPGGFPRGENNFAVSSCPVGIGADSGTSGADGQDGTGENPLWQSMSGGTGASGGSSDTVVCYIGFGQDHFNFIYSSASNYPCARMENLYGGGGGASYYQVGYSRDTSATKKVQHTIPLSTLKDRDGNNVTDLAFGAGATTLEAASFGGGGNRLFPTAGNGAVVVIY